MTTQTVMPPERTDEAQEREAVRCSALLADLVDRWRKAETHWRKRASAIDRDYKDQPIYEDGLAEAFGRCADILVNTMVKSANSSSTENNL